MKKTTWIILFVCLSFLFAGAVAAEMYVGGKLGYVMTSDSDLSDGVDEISIEFDGGLGLGLALGTTMDAFRIEGELEYRGADMDKAKAYGVSVPVDGDIKTWSLMANGYYDFETGSSLKPYAGVGIGFAKHSVEINSIAGDAGSGGEDDDTVFAYQGTLGVAWAVSDTMDLDFAYRYFATADAEFEDGAGTTEAEYGSHNLSAGLRIKF